MNVYDFDGTIYKGDSTVDFYFFSLRHKPALIFCFPKQLRAAILYMFGIITKTEFKERFFCFLSKIDAVSFSLNFWKKNAGRIYKWYLDQQRPDDIIISASPEFLLIPICRQLNIHNLIASKVDPKSGKYIGQNCRGSEKVRRLEEEYHISHIDRFYSDSSSDSHLAKLADKAFIVKDGTIHNWNIEAD